jgi:hypothetical protein
MAEQWLLSRTLIRAGDVVAYTRVQNIRFCGASWLPQLLQHASGAARFR